jgi:hypothetical protein
MKKILFALLAALALPLLAETIEGQKSLQVAPVTWTSGANTGKTRLKIVSPDSSTHRVYLDTSTTGQTGAWKRIDNTADSCSQPFLITSDSTGVTRPVWENRLWQLTKAADADSSTHQYRVQTRERQHLSPVAGRRVVGWTPWTAKGANLGSNSVAMQDSILMANARFSGSKISQYSFFYVAGTQARLCPDNVAGTGKAIGDSVIVDSLRVYAR